MGQIFFTSREMIHAGAMIAVWMDVPKEHDNEFNDWYETEHLAEVVGLEGVLSGHRYYNPDGELRYLVCYETVDETVEGGEGFQGMLANPTPWTRRIRKLCGGQTRRSNFRMLYDTGAAGFAGAMLAVRSSEGPRRFAAKSRGEAPATRVRYRVFQGAARPDAWLEIYDFQNLDGARAAGTDVPLRKESRVEIYEAIGTPRVRSGFSNCFVRAR